MKGLYYIIGIVAIIFIHLCIRNQWTHINNSVVKMEIQGCQIQLTVTTGISTQSHSTIVDVPFVDFNADYAIVVTPANKHAALLPVYIQHFGVGFASHALRYFGIAYPAGFTLYCGDVAFATHTMYKWDITVMETKTQ